MSVTPYEAEGGEREFVRLPAQEFEEMDPEVFALHRIVNALKALPSETAQRRLVSLIVERFGGPPAAPSDDPAAGGTRRGRR